MSDAATATILPPAAPPAPTRTPTTRTIGAILPDTAEWSPFRKRCIAFGLGSGGAMVLAAIFGGEMPVTLRDALEFNGITAIVMQVGLVIGGAETGRALSSWNQRKAGLLKTPKPKDDEGDAN